MLGASGQRFGETNTKAVRSSAETRTTRLGCRYRGTQSTAVPTGRAREHVIQGAGTDPPSAGAVSNLIPRYMAVHGSSVTACIPACKADFSRIQPRVFVSLGNNKQESTIRYTNISKFSSTS